MLLRIRNKVKCKEAKNYFFFSLLGLGQIVALSVSAHLLPYSTLNRPP
jgi:hypothetical protein